MYLMLELSTGDYRLSDMMLLVMKLRELMIMSKDTVHKGYRSQEKGRENKTQHKHNSFPSLNCKVHKQLKGKRLKLAP